MKVQEMLPDVYYKESRDFAFIGRLIEIVFNYMKTGADCVLADANSQNAFNNVVDLLVNTLGFDSKHEYSVKDLSYIATAFSYLIKNKGTKTAINTAIRLLLNSQGIKKYSTKNFINKNNGGLDINIRIPDKLKDLVLIEDLFDYILPAGALYTFERVNSEDNNYETKLKDASVTRVGNQGEYSSFIALDDTGRNLVEEFPECPQDINIDELGTIGTGTIYTSKILSEASEADYEAESQPKMNAPKKSAKIRRTVSKEVEIKNTENNKETK